MSTQKGPWESDTCAISNERVCYSRLKCFNFCLTKCQKPSEITEGDGNMMVTERRREGGSLKRGLDHSFPIFSSDMTIQLILTSMTSNVCFLTQ